MIRQLVNSSRIRSVGWQDNTLEVEFHDGAIYQYYNVSSSTYSSFICSPSLGSALSRIDKVYPYRRIN